MGGGVSSSALVAAEDDISSVGSKLDNPQIVRKKHSKDSGAYGQHIIGSPGGADPLLEGAMLTQEKQREADISFQKQQ
jgi:hypothetical protein